MARQNDRKVPDDHVPLFMGAQDIGILDVLRTKGELRILIPNNPEAIHVLIEHIANTIHDTEFEEPLRPFIDSLQFELEVAKRSTFPPGSA